MKIQLLQELEDDPLYLLLTACYEQLVGRGYDPGDVSTWLMEGEEHLPKKGT